MRQPKNNKNIIDMDLTMAGKMPPHSLDLEEFVIGGVMMERDKFYLIEGIINEDDFYKQEHRLIFKAIRYLAGNNQSTDILNVTERLRFTGELEQAGGAYGVTMLTMSVAGTHEIDEKAKKLKEYSIIRNIIQLCGKYCAQGFEPGIDAFDFKDRLLGEIENCGRISISQIDNIGSISRKTLEKMREDAAKPDSEMIKLPGSIPGLSQKTYGYQEPDLIILAAGPAEGKTTYALQEAYHLAKCGKPVAFVCMEMKAYQLCLKLFSASINEEFMQLKFAKNIPESKWNDLEILVREMQNVPLYIVDATGQNVNQITALTKEFKRKYNVQMLFIDYIQLISGGTDQKFGTRELEVSYISRKLKENCMAMNIPTMALSQLTVEKGVKRMYELADLRESKAIGMNADVVDFLYWPHYHGVETLNNDVYGKNDSLYIRKKGRMTGQLVHKLKFYSQFNKFEDNVTMADIIAESKPVKRLQSFSEPLKEDEDLPF